MTVRRVFFHPSSDSLSARSCCCVDEDRRDKWTDRVNPRGRRGDGRDRADVSGTSAASGVTRVLGARGRSNELRPLHTPAGARARKKNSETEGASQKCPSVFCVR